jgi:hypothetical protein
MDDVLKEELESIYVGVPGFYEAFFEEIPDLKSIDETLFKIYREKDNPLYNEEGG